METYVEDYFEGDEREPLLAKVKAARSVAKIYELLLPDTLESY